MARTRAIPVDQLFWSILDPVLGDNRCWVWPRAHGAFDYGTFNLYLEDGDKEERVHRVAWTLAFGRIPPGKSVLHICDNPPCARPSHLFLGTQADNVRDMMQKGRGIAPTKEEAWGRTNHGHTLYMACILCGTTDSPHKSLGRCRKCWERLRRQANPTYYQDNRERLKAVALASYHRRKHLRNK